MSAQELAGVSSRHGRIHINKQVTHVREAYASVALTTVTSTLRICTNIQNRRRASNVLAYAGVTVISI